MVYKWKDGSKMSCDANKVNSELQELGDFITPKQVVKYAKSSKRELHKCFEWDDGKASELYRENQARETIRSIVIVPEDTKLEIIKTEIKAYENVIIDEKRVYVTTERILKDEDLTNQVLNEISASISHLEKKARTYENVSKSILEVRKSLTKTKNVIEMAIVGS